MKKKKKKKRNQGKENQVRGKDQKQGCTTKKTKKKERLKERKGWWGKNVPPKKIRGLKNHRNELLLVELWQHKRSREEVEEEEKEKTRTGSSQNIR